MKPPIVTTQHWQATQGWSQPNTVVSVTDTRTGLTVSCGDGSSYQIKRAKALAKLDTLLRATK